MERRLRKFISFCSRHRRFQTYEPVSQGGIEFTATPSIPIDVLREILEHVPKADLATLCRVNKIFCSCSRDVLYRKIEYEVAHVIQTLAQSTDLARRVRSFKTTRSLLG
jgi:F-box domain